MSFKERRKFQPAATVLISRRRKLLPFLATLAGIVKQVSPLVFIHILVNPSR